MRRYSLHRSDGTIALDGPIRFDAVSAAALRRSLNELRGEPELRVLIQSDGGEIAEGFAIYSLLRNAEKPVEITVRWACSMAAVIAMAGSRILIEREGAFLLHNCAVQNFEPATNSGSRVTARHLSTLSRSLGRIDAMHVDVICSRTGLDRSTVERLREADTVIGAAEAVRLGFADEVVMLPSSHPIEERRCG